MEDVSLQQQIKAHCIQLLTRREHSQGELRDKLYNKGFEGVDVETVITDLAENGWQSDLRFAESYSRYRIRKGFGPIKIRYELQLRGIRGFNLDDVVLELAEDWFELLRQLYCKKYSDDGQPSQKEWLKRSRFLLQRGFSGELIKQLYHSL